MLKKHLAAALIAAAVPALLVTPAGAAVPSKPAKLSLACPDGVGTARVWSTTHKGALTKFAVDNPCSQYLSFSSGHYASGSSRDRLLVAPGTHFNWGKSRITWARGQGAVVFGEEIGWRSTAECGGPTTVVVVTKYNEVHYAVDENGDTC